MLGALDSSLRFPTWQLIALVCLLGATGPAPAAFPGGNGKIAFATDRDGDVQIYAMNPDGSAQTRLTLVGTFNVFPAWSADGTRIAFTRNDDVFIMDADGGNVTQVTTDPADDEVPAWSPSGTQLVFRSNRNGNAEIYKIDTNGANPVRLTNNGAQDTNPVWSPDGTKIAFQSDRDGDSEIHVMDANGGNVTQLTSNAASDTDPDWSPDGGQIAFTSSRDGNTEIYVMNANGTGQTRITNNAAADNTPAWSPDGTKITFTSTRDGDEEVYVMNANGTGQTNLSNDTIFFDGRPDWQPIPLGTNGPLAFTSTRDGDSEIYKMNPDGSGQTRLTNNPAGEGFGRWSPDGTQLVFESDRDGDFEIFKMNADGSGVVQLTFNTTADSTPAWSNDGSKIVFRSDRNGGDYEIYSMNANGSTQTRLTNTAADDSNPAWSPLGDAIAFHSLRNGNWEIYLMNPDGSGQTRITNNVIQDQSPDWSPDGSQIVFQSNRDGDYEIYKMTAGGASPTRLTSEVGFDSGPSWSPDGARIAFTTFRDANAEVYVMETDGSNQTNISNNVANDIVSDWGAGAPVITGDFELDNGSFELGGSPPTGWTFERIDFDDQGTCTITAEEEVLVSDRSFAGTQSFKGRIRLDCNTHPSDAKEEYGAAIKSDAANTINIPAGNVSQFRYITLWANPETGLGCNAPGSNDCQFFRCESGTDKNYDGSHRLTMTFFDPAGNLISGADGRIDAERHGGHCGHRCGNPDRCFQHVGENLSEADVDAGHHWFRLNSESDNPGSAAEKRTVGGRDWYRYTVEIPDSPATRATDIRVGMSATQWQNYFSEGETLLWIDAVCVSDASGNCFDSEGLAPGQVLPDITVGKVTAGQIRISWSGSDCAGGEDYGIYEGAIGVWYSHSRIACTDEEADRVEDVTVSPQSSYYLVVSHNDGTEGSYGTDSGLDERPVGTVVCETLQQLGCP